MKKSLMVIFVIALVIGVATSAACAGDWGCECILCMSNPGGATEYKECRPPIRKLERHLARGGRFPGCEGAESSGYGIKQGYERYYSCQESYGKEYRLTTIETSGERYSSKKVCRKFTGHKIVDRPIKWRTKPHYVELIAPDGEKRERVYYKKKRKKKGMF
jgi:hypothetical protein